MNLVPVWVRDGQPLQRPSPVLRRELGTFGPIAVEAGLPKDLIGCPFFVGEPDDVELLNRYLRARHRGTWHPGIGRDQDEKQITKGEGREAVIEHARKPARPSLIQVAYNVRNFCSWWACKTQDDDDWASRLEDAVQSIIEEYATDMEDGLWSVSGAPLENNTVRQRQIEAIQFLRWAKFEGLTPRFVLGVLYRSVQTASWSGARTTRIRRNYVILRRPNPVTIKFPTTEQAREHVRGILDPACQLGAILVYALGLRASEVISIPADAFTKRVHWSGGQPHIIVKGKGGRTRKIEISAELLRIVRHFIQFERAIRLAGVSKPEQTTALLVRSDGSSLTYRSFWRAYRTKDRLSPHLGRHWYAVNYLLAAFERIKADAAVTGRILGELGAELETDLIRLQANLGHASYDTTRQYLVCLSQQMRPIDLGLAFQAILDG